VERYFLQGFHRWQVEWVEVVSAEGVVLPTDPVLLSLQTIVGLAEGPRNPLEESGKIRLVAQPGGVSIDRVAQQYARSTVALGTNQLWAALRQVGCCRADRERMFLIGIHRPPLFLSTTSTRA
jgi:hypothetical protein